eukprot:gene17343-22889_t
MSNEETNNDEVLAKYKKLLSLARSSLESNQATIAAKDKQISQLLAALEEERSNRLKKSTNTSKEDDLSLMPRNLLRRVDLSDNCIWILIEYEGIEDSWKLFTSEQELDEFIQRVPGVPLTKPHRSLSSIESKLIEEESKKRVDKIIEEFRRFKVRSEISRKQKDSGNKLSLTSSPISSSSAISELDISNIEDINKLRLQYQEQELKWKSAFEKVVRENEQLRTRGNDIQIAIQLRERYEQCLKEKNELEEKIKVYDKLLRDNSGSGGKSFEQLYIELRDEYKEFRRRVQAIETQRQIEEELKNSNNNYNNNNQTNGFTDHSKDNDSYHDSNIMSQMWPGNPKGIVESKIQYIRQMVFQYLSCKDSEVKLHIESALVAIFRFNDHEKAAIEQRVKDESQDTLTSITNFLGGFTS